jgi:hypothetical protein
MIHIFAPEIIPMNPFLRKPLLSFSFCLLAASFPASRAVAGIGLNIAASRPYGDFGMMYKYGPAFQLYYVVSGHDERFRPRFFVTHASYKPRMESFPVYEIESGSPPVIHPRELKLENVQLTYVGGQLEIKAAEFKGFYLYFGAGLLGGGANATFDQETNGMIVENSASGTEIIGARFGGSIEYDISPRFAICIDAWHNAITTPDGTTQYSHTNAGVGLNFCITCDD